MVSFAIGRAAVGPHLGVGRELGGLLAGVSLASPPCREAIAALRDVLRHDIGLVVKTAETPETPPSPVFASTDQHPLRRCPCPVRLCMPHSRAVPHRVIAAVDLGSPDGVDQRAATA